MTTEVAEGTTLGARPPPRLAGVYASLHVPVLNWPRLRPLLAGALVFALLLGLMWVVDQAQGARHMEGERVAAMQRLGTVRARLEAALNTRLALAHVLAALVRSRDGTVDPADFAEFARDLIVAQKGVRGVELAPDGIVSHVYPRPGNAADVGRDLHADAAGHPLPLRASISGPLRAAGGGEVVDGRLPVFVEAPGGERLWGYAQVVMDLPALLSAARLRAHPDDLKVALRVRMPPPGAGERRYGATSVFDADPVVMAVSAPLTGGRWVLAAEPVAGWSRSWPSRAWLWGAGMPLALAVSLLVAALARTPTRLRRAVTSATRRLRETEVRLKSIADNSPAMILLKDKEGRYVLVNRRFEEVYHRRDAQLRGKTVYDLFPPEIAEEFAAHDRRVIAAREPMEREIVVPDGERELIFAALKFPVFDESGNVVGVGGVERDITDRKHAEAALRESEERYRALHENHPSMFFTIDAHGVIVSVNQFGATRMGYGAGELVGRPLADFVSPPARRRLADKLSLCLHDAGCNVHGFETQLERHDGRAFWARVSARALEQAGGERNALIVCEDISEAHRLSEQLSYQASHDALTDLANRRAFEQRLGHVLAMARTDGSEHALCYLDLDQFKVINDTCGHVAGDELLRQVGRLLSRHVRRHDMVARMGGDEFTVLMEHCSEQQALRVAQDVRGELEETRFPWQGRSFRLGASIGLVAITRRTESVAALLAAADTACYAAKDAGRNRVHVYRQDDAELARRHGEMHWVARVQAAMDEQRLTLFYQPIVPVPAEAQARGRPPHHYELLLRMRDEQGELVPPGAFLPAAERFNLMAKVDRWVVGTALAWLRAHPAHLRELEMCSINLSGQSLTDEGFLAFIDGEMEDLGADAARICFEITETAAISNLASATRLIERLRTRGCRFALDDFGSGLSSFGYLKTLPVDYLKIDGMFVRDVLEDPMDLAMVRAIHHIGEVLGKRTIAESVESDAILAKLVEMGVHYAQGYGVGRPRPLDELG